LLPFPIAIVKPPEPTQTDVREADFRKRTVAHSKPQEAHDRADKHHRTAALAHRSDNVLMRESASSRFSSEFA